MSKFSKANKIIFFIIIMVIVCVIGIGITAAVIFGKNKSSTSTEKTYTKTVVHTGELEMNFTGDGTTEISTTSQLFGLNYTNGDITVENVKISSGDTVKKNGTIYTVSKSDVKSAVSYYKSAVKEATSNLNKVKLQYEVGVLEARYTKELSSSTASLSTTTLSQSLEELQDTQDEAMEAYNDAKTQINTLTKNINNNTYYKTYKVASLKKSYEDAIKKVETTKKAYNTAKKKQKTLDSYNKKVTEYETKLDKSIDNYNKTLKEMYTLLGLNTDDFVGVTKNTKESTEEETTKVSTTLPSTQPTKVKSSLSASNLTELTTLVTSLNKLEKERKDYQSKIDEYQSKADKVQEKISNSKTKYNQAKQNLTMAKQKYTQGKESYTKAFEESKNTLTETKNNLSNLLTTYQQATRDKVTKAVSLNTQYSQSQLDGQSAEQIYESTITSWESTLKEAKNNLKNLKEEQKIINRIKDGKVKANKAGTIASKGYSEEDTLNASTELVSYYNTKTISISVEVDQNNIGNLKVGDEATVTISNARQGELTGKITSIATEATSSGSSSTVTYSVTVSVDNSNGMLSAGTSATVKFSGETKDNITYVSSSAVYTKNNKSYVYMYDEDQNVVKKTVQIGSTTDEYTEITSGVSSGDVCLIESNDSQVGGSTSEEK